MSDASVTPSARSANDYMPLLVVIAVLLLLSVGLTGFQVFSTSQQNQIAAERAATYTKRAQAAEDLATSQQSAISSLLDDYQKEAYNNPQVTTIYQQQLVSSEFALRALQVIAIQNSQIVQLLATTP